MLSLKPALSHRKRNILNFSDYLPARGDDQEGLLRVRPHPGPESADETHSFSPFRRFVQQIVESFGPQQQQTRQTGVKRNELDDANRSTNREAQAGD